MVIIFLNINVERELFLKYFKGTVFKHELIRSSGNNKS
jgi:hypothetical protein